MSPGRTERVTEARIEDIRSEIRELAEKGVRPTARTHPALYGQARRCNLNWRYELSAARARKRAAEPSRDIHQFVREVDAISAHQVLGLPRYMRERQLLGGRMLEIAAATLQNYATGEWRPTVEGMCDQQLLSNALIAALREWREAGRDRHD